MNSFSTVPLLCALLLLFWLYQGFRTARSGTISLNGLVLLTLWLAILGAWGVVSMKLALSGYYGGDGLLRLLPGLWVPVIPIAATALFAAMPLFRKTILAMVLRHPKAQVLAHVARVTAIGGVYKGFNGLLPASFALPVGIPDALFGLSALALVILWPKDGWTPRVLMIWNLAGIAVILPAAPLLMQMGLPGPLHVFTSLPDARTLFHYPMVLAPTLIVPLFITMNAFNVVALWVQSRATRQATR